MSDAGAAGARSLEAKAAMRAAEPHRCDRRLWSVAVPAALVAVVVLAVVGGRLSGLETSGDRFGPIAFVGPRFPLTDTGLVGDALAAWTSDPTIGAAAGSLVLIYLLVDLFVLVPAYIALSWSLLRWLATPRLGAGRRWRRTVDRLPFALLAIEVAEGVATLGLLEPWSWDERAVGPNALPSSMLVIVPVLSTMKWVLVVGLVITMAVLGYANMHRLLPRRRSESRT